MEVNGIIHCHSTYSYDGKLPLPELKQLLVKSGIQFVCMTEHVDELDEVRARAFVEECRSLSDSSFLFIPGFEVPYKHAHILMIGQTRFFGNYAPTIEALREWTETTAFVVLAHPVRNDFDVDDGLLQSIHALEVWNQQYEGKHVPRTRSLTLLKELRKEKQGLLAIGGVDLHRSEHMGPPRVTLEVDTLEEGAVLEKLTMGAFRVHSPHATFYGTLPNVEEVQSLYRIKSLFSVLVITLGKTVNKFLATLGLSLPKGLKQFVRKGI